MKSQIYSILLILLCLQLLPVSNHTTGVDLEEKEDSIIDPFLFKNQKRSVSILQTGTPIFIDGDAAFHGNASAEGWNNGGRTGTAGSPYLLDSLNISDHPADVIIDIRNTDVYFQINNSFLAGGLVGIRLENVSNGIITNNVVMNNSIAGSYLDNSHDNYFSGNTFANNTGSGINTNESGNITISNNFLLNNSLYGIDFSESENCTISDNTASFNWESGIRIGWLSINNTLLRNFASNNTKNGINLGQFANSTVLINNTVINSGQNGMKGYYMINSTLINNTVANSGADGGYSSTGIYIQYAENIVLKNNTASNNPDRGIQLDRCPNSTLKYNVANDNSYGIYLGYCENSTLVDSRVTNHSRNGLYLTQSPNCTVRNNYVTNSGDYGVYMFYCSNSTVENNIVTNSDDDGLYLYKIQDSLIKNNTVSNSKTYGSYSVVCHNSVFVDNKYINGGFYFYESTLVNSLKLNVINNTVNGKPLVFWENKTQTTVPFGAGQIILVNCTSIEITNQSISNASIGVFALFSTHLDISDNDIQGNLDGIYLKLDNDTTCYNNELSNNDDGIVVQSCAGNITVRDNIIIDCLLNGISFSYSGNCTILNNQFKNCGLYFSGTEPNDFIPASMSNNLVNGKPVLYWENVTGELVPSGYGQVILVNSPNIIVTGLTWKTSVGVQAAFSNNLTVYNCSFYKNNNGVKLQNCSYFNVSQNIYTQSNTAISASYSEYGVIFNNTIVDYINVGISIGNSKLITVSTNAVAYGLYGISISGGKNATIINNVVMINSYQGIIVKSSDYSNISMNTITNSGQDHIRLEKSDYSQITSNFASQSSLRGFYIPHTVENITIKHNVIINSSDYAITCNTGHNMTISNNSFIDNNLGGSSQIYCNGNNNLYNYNYWNNWTTPDTTPADGFVDVPYDIGGDTKNDEFPLTTPATSHQLSPLIIWYPLRNDNVSGIVALQWSRVVDSWGHSITYNVSYSNGSTSWTELASELTGVTYAWDIIEVTKNLSYRIKVIASDDQGLTIETISDAFFVRDLHTITSPTITYPVGGEILSGNVTIVYDAATDSWGDAITYNLYYSADGGNTWNVLVTNYSSNSSYVWDTTTVADGTYLIKVVAVCSTGLSAEAISPDSFTILNNPQPEKPSDDDDQAPIIVMGLAGVTLICASVALLLRRRKLGR